MSVPLEGLIVAELGSGVATALAARMMAGYGAEVLKIEPPQGDPMRATGPFAHGAAGLETSAPFLYFHGGKLSVVLDLATAACRAALRQLLDGVDVLLTDMPVSQRVQLGLSSDTAVDMYPRLSVIAISPYGETGPYSEYQATDLTQFATGGQMALMGEPGREPLKSYGNQAECQAAFHAFSAAMAAILFAKRTGSGQYVELSTQELQASAMEAQGPLAYNGDSLAKIPGRSGNHWRPIWSQYPCKDGYVGIFVNVMNIPAFFRAIGRPDLLPRANDDQFMATELQPIVESWCAERTRHEVYTVAVEFGAPLSYVATPDDLLDSEVVGKTGIWRDVEHPIAGSFRTPGPPFRANASEFTLRRAPLFGEHTSQVLRARTNLSDADVRTLLGQAALSRHSGAA